MHSKTHYNAMCPTIVAASYCPEPLLSSSVPLEKDTRAEITNKQKTIKDEHRAQTLVTKYFHKKGVKKQ